MLKIILTKGVPASGKSTWAKSEIARDPLNWARVNNDQIREMLNESVYSPDYEKLVSSTRLFLIKEALKRNKNVIIDNVNANKSHFEDAVKAAKLINIDVQITEKPFYIELEEAIERDSKREGKAKVGPEVIKKFWKSLGGKQFQHYIPKIEIVSSRNADSNLIEPAKQNELAPKAIICDLDGSIANISHRSPYDASKCLDDQPVTHVVEMVKLFHQNGYQIIFCSGREDKFQDLTSQWLNLHVGINYQLFMRPAGNFEKDCIIKENIYNNHIKDKYYVRAVIDDRLQVAQLWYKLGLPLFRVGDPDANF